MTITWYNKISNMAILNNSFIEIAISEKRISKFLPILNLEIPEYTFPFNVTECSARDTSIYVAKKLGFKSCSDHSSCYRSRQLEPTSTETKSP